ncbi:MAG: hypothetical protein EXS31_10780 [Pedosphaera sp.]|nr:hypothetical protein [Pedosphaera sp.]
MTITKFNGSRSAGQPASPGWGFRARALVLFLLLAHTIADADPAIASKAFVSAAYPTFASWKAACDRLPFNRQLQRSLPPRDLWPLKNFKEFDELLDAFFALSKAGPLAQTNSWAGTVPKREEFFDTDRVYYQRTGVPFQPFAQKLRLPTGSRVSIHGDWHGDIHSLLALLDHHIQSKALDGFKIVDPNLHFLFLGDNTDRGVFGIEVLYTLFRLKLENPDRVWLGRGNHEDISLGASYGFVSEVQAKYGAGANVAKIMRAYDFLPVVTYVGCGNDFAQCNHGGMEPGFDPVPLLNMPVSLGFKFLGRLDQSGFVREHPGFIAGMDAASKRVAEGELRNFLPDSPVVPYTLGFMWNDFSIVPGEGQLAVDPGRAIVYGDVATAEILKAASRGAAKLRAVFRAHQHSSLINPMMRRLKASGGVFRHWQSRDSLDQLLANEPQLHAMLDHSEERPIPANSVWTFNVSPDSVYGAGCVFDLDSSGILTLQEHFEDWRLKVVNIPVMIPVMKK